MATIDWQELYAANRAVIEGGRVRGHDGPPLGGRVRGHEGPLPAASLPLAAGGDVLHVPRDLPAGPAPLLVMLHGCSQTPASLAAATRMNAAADRHGFVVLYPEQTRQDNQQACWNWFQPNHRERGGGEPARIAAAVRAVGARREIDPGRVFVAGLSAGGAMAAIMAATHPDLFAGLAVHSGLPFGSASALGPAFAAMTQGSEDPVAGTRAARRAMGRHARPVPTLVIHGSADRTVAPVNGEQLVAQWLDLNGLSGPPTATAHGQVPGGHAYARMRWEDGDGRLLLGHLAVDGLGHAWSGGAPGQPFSDERGPSATDAIWAFFSEAAGTRP